MLELGSGYSIRNNIRTVRFPTGLAKVKRQDWVQLKMISCLGFSEVAWGV